MIKTYFYTLLLCTMICFIQPIAVAQDLGDKNRVNLQDVNIQGEANRNQTLFLNRNKLDLDERVKIRRDFRKELEEGIPSSFNRLPEETLKN